MTGDRAQPIANDLWLAVHDDVRGRSSLPDRSRGYGLGGALLAELIAAGGALVVRGRLHLAAHSPVPHDPALADLVRTLGGDRTPAPDDPASDPWDGSPTSPHPPSGPGFPGPPAAGRSDARPEPPWPARDPDGWPMPQDGQEAGRWWATEPTAPYPPTGRHSRDGEAPYPVPSGTWRRDSRPPPVAVAGPGQDLPEFLDYLAYDLRAETLVVDRLLTTGAVRVHQRRRLFGTTDKVVPRDGNVSGWPAARIRTRLTTEPHRLPPSDLILAALLGALNQLSTDQNRLRAGEARLLKQQLDTDLPPMIRDVCIAVEVAFRQVALNR